MKKSPKQISFRHLLLSGAIATLSTLAPSLTTHLGATLEDSPKTVVDEVWQIVNREFVDQKFNSLDWQNAREELLDRQYGNREEAYLAIRKALKELGDPYTRFLDPEEFEALTNQTSGELSGIGVAITINEETKILTVVQTLKDSPAMKAGIKAGDKIIKINNKLTSLMSLEQASEEISGEEGTDVDLEFLRGDETLVITVRRAKIEVPSVSYDLKEEGQLRVGYIQLDEFSAHAAEQMKGAIEDLQTQEVSGFVLDLRGNPGGLLFASVDIARMFLENGKIVKTSNRRGGDRQFSANRTALTDLPLVVLVDRNSASASEILAGAFKDNGRATIVGDRTFGKGTVQSVHSLSDGSGLAVTISRYYPPSGIDINQHGVSPDIMVELTREDKQQLRNNPDLFATAKDPYYARAIAILTDGARR